MLRNCTWISDKERIKKQKEKLLELSRKVGTNDKQTLALKQQYEIQHQSFAQKELMLLRSELSRAETELKVFKADSKEIAIRPLPEEAIEEELRPTPACSSI